MSNLTYIDRQLIEFGLRHNQSLRKIAMFLRKDHTVVSREVKKNIGDYLPYSSLTAQTNTKIRSRYTNKRKLDKCEELRSYVCRKFIQDWSPEQISGRLKNNPPPSLVDKYICPESIYQYIYKVEPQLYHKLRRKHYKRTRLKGRKKQSKKINIPDRVSIHLRDKQINKRARVGDWETDLMEFSKQKYTLSVDIDRRSRLVRVHKLKDKSANEKLDALNQTLRDLPNNLKYTITFDNGTENVRHKELTTEHNIKTYFCDTYSSWQKGSVENTNGLIRQYFPRKTNLQKVPHRTIYEVQEKLNNRPRKCLQYKTPNEIINE